MGDSDISVLLKQVRERKPDDRTLAQRAAELAQKLLTVSQKCLHSDERVLLSALSKLVADDKSRRFLNDLCGKVFAVSSPDEQSSSLRKLLTEFGGIPTFFSTVGRLRFKAASAAPRSMQNTAMAEVRRVFRSTFAELTLPTQIDKLGKRIREGAKDCMSYILAPLSPTVMGHKSAERYLKNLEAVLSHGERAGIAVQPERLCPMLSLYSPEFSARELAKALKQLLRTAAKAGNPRRILVETGTSETLPIVVEGVKLALAGTEFHHADLVLELPAYLRESAAVLRSLTDWATARAAKGAAPLRVLIVKGSHLSDEQVLAYTHGLGMGLCGSKAETETRFKQLVHAAISAKAKAIRPVIGTHNLFDIAYALADWARSGRDGLPSFTFIAGVGNHIGRMLAKEGAEVSLKTAISSEDGGVGFENYLRSLINELARPDGFLAAGFPTESNSMGWGRMRQHFLASLSGREEQPAVPEEAPAYRTTLHHALTRTYTDEFYAAAQAEMERRQEKLPLVVAGKEAESPLVCIKRSLTASGMEDYRFVSADYAAVDSVLTAAQRAGAGEPADSREMGNQLLKLARKLEKERLTLASLLVRDAGFTMADAETELRDAIGACYFYEESMSRPGFADGTRPTPLGVVVVAPDDAHPLSDAVAGIAAARCMGNTVIYKPSAHTTLLGSRIAALLRETDMTEPAVLFLPCLDNQIADKLMTDSRVDGVICHGRAGQGHKVALTAPTHTLLCTSTGAAAAYLAPSADWQTAIPNVLQAVVRRSGQDVLCPHVLLVHADIYDNQLFINALKDAAGLYRAGSGQHEGADIAPPVSPQAGERMAALMSPESKLTWLVQPYAAEMVSQIYSLGICTGIASATDFARRAEGLPVLGVIRVESTVSATGMMQCIAAGRAAAIYSEDEEEIRLWQQYVGCAVLGINTCPQYRPGLQPVGSYRPALQGCGVMMGGGNYLTALARWQEIDRPQLRGKQRNIPFAPWDTLSPKPSNEETMRLTTAADSISYWWEKEFGIEHVLSPQPGTETRLRYVPVSLCIRVGKTTSDIDLAIALMAALKAGCNVQLSTVSMRAWMPRCLEQLGVPVLVENREEFESRFAALASEGIRVRDTAATDRTMAAAASCNLWISRESVLANGRLEMLHCMQEQIITRHTARFGLL